MQINSLAFQANTSDIFLMEEAIDYFYRLSQTLLNDLEKQAELRGYH